MDTDYAATQGVALTLCRFERELDVLRVVQPEVRGRLAYLVRFPSGLGVNAPLDRAYVTDLFGAAMQEIDLESVTPLRRIRVGYGAAGAAVSHDGLRVFVGRPLRSRVDVFNAVSLDRVGKYQVGFGVSIFADRPAGPLPVHRVADRGNGVDRASRNRARRRPAFRGAADPRYRLLPGEPQTVYFDAVLHPLS
ncbi:MAG: hypothetical protein M5R36_06730 [Deltaproteobacteria bacterium]|nr:hypothetical protein [Deltaproteobacteria bacterium]